MASVSGGYPPETEGLRSQGLFRWQKAIATVQYCPKDGKAGDTECHFDIQGSFPVAYAFSPFSICAYALYTPLFFNAEAQWKRSHHGGKRC